jgi:SAM-dependent methyltransferase
VGGSDMGERKLDRSLSIRTVGIREWGFGEVHYNRYEATPYTALDKLFERYRLDKSDSVVDFGCGRGRVAFYIHNRFHVPVTGIEANDKTYEEALSNIETYRLRAKHIRAPIEFKYGLAEHYEIQPEENKFYFFNPFSIKIFRQVVNNILESVKENPRTVDLIIYYPTAQYKQFLKKDTPFQLINKVKIPGTIDRREKFLIYRLRQEDIELEIG